jgi:chromate transporter
MGFAPWSQAVGGTDSTLGELFWFFVKAGSVVFGSGLAIVPFLYGGTVVEHGWLNDRQFLDAVAVAMVTPGPVVITVGFIGYLVSGTAGLFTAAIGVFLPVFLFVVLPAPYFRRAGAHPGVRAFVTGVTAAATGAIAGAAWVLAGRALVDGWSVALAALSLFLVSRRRIPDLAIVVLSGVIGWCIWRF